MQPRDGGPSYPAYQNNGGFRGENQQFSRNVCPMRCILCMMNVVCLMVVVLLCCVVLRVTDDGCEKP